MRLCINMLIFTHNLGNWLITRWAAVLISFVVHLMCGWVVSVEGWPARSWLVHVSSSS